MNRRDFIIYTSGLAVLGLTPNLPANEIKSVSIHIPIKYIRDNRHDVFNRYIQLFLVPKAKAAGFEIDETHVKNLVKLLDNNKIKLLGAIPDLSGFYKPGFRYFILTLHSDKTFSIGYSGEPTLKSLSSS